MLYKFRPYYILNDSVQDCRNSLCLGYKIIRNEKNRTRW